MITIRTNVATTATPVKTYDKRDRAQKAAVREIGEHAREGFEYETTKVDGRWIWRATDEVPPMTQAQLKANGGKRAELPQAIDAAIQSGMSPRQFRAVAERVADELADRAHGNPASVAVKEVLRDSNGVAQSKGKTLHTFKNGRTMWMTKTEIETQNRLEAEAEKLAPIANKIVADKQAQRVASGAPPCKVIKDPDHKDMFCVQYSDGSLSGSLNHTRANQIAMSVNKSESLDTVEEKDPKDHSVRAPRQTKTVRQEGATRPDGFKEGSPAAILVDTLCRSGGATHKELCEAVGWKECLPMTKKYAAKAGITISTVKNPGELTRYVGTRASAV